VRWHHEKGSSLIELLAVLVILTTVIAVITSSQMAWFNTTKDLPKQTLNQEKLRFAFEQLVKDIEQAESIEECNPCDGISDTNTIKIKTTATEEIVYQYDDTAQKIMITKQGITFSIAEGVISFIVEHDRGFYWIEGKIQDLDIKTGQPYTLTTSVKPIEW